MPELAKKMESCDPVWSEVRELTEKMAAKEPMLASFLHATILNHQNFESALSFHLSQKLGSEEMPSMLLRQVFDEALAADPSIGIATRADLNAVNDRDPACDCLLTPLLYFKGFHALQAYRVAHYLWRTDRKAMGLFLQNRISELFGVDVHPAAKIGKGVMIDHATAVVIGETCVIEDDVSLLHSVTLGGTGKETGDRHPKVRRGALISVGAQVLGNIEVGERSRVGAGSVVLKDVPAGCTAAGVPAKIVGCAGSSLPSHAMEHAWQEEDDPAMWI